MKCTREQLCGIYNECAPRYDKCILWLDRVAGIENMRRELFQQASGAVLDVATGTGANYEFFPSDCTITGVDLSVGMLDLAKNKAEKLGKKVVVQPMNAEQLEFPSESFDTVTSGLSLCTIPNPLKALEEIARVCRKDGKILLLEHGPSDWRLIAAAQKLLLGEWYVRKFGCHWDREPHELAEQAGLSIKEHRRQFLGMLHAIEARKS